MQRTSASRRSCSARDAPARVASSCSAKPWLYTASKSSGWRFAARAKRWAASASSRVVGSALFSGSGACAGAAAAPGAALVLVTCAVAASQSSIYDDGAQLAAVSCSAASST